MLQLFAIQIIIILLDHYVSAIILPFSIVIESIFEDLILLDKLLYTFRCFGILIILYFLITFLIFILNIDLLNQSPIYRLASKLMDLNNLQDATNKKGKMSNNKHKEHIRKVHPIQLYLICFDNILYPKIFMLFTFGPLTCFLFKYGSIVLY